jgi:hypothetical protein
MLKKNNTGYERCFKLVVSSKVRVSYEVVCTGGIKAHHPVRKEADVRTKDDSMRKKFGLKWSIQCGRKHMSIIDACTEWKH